MISEESGSSWLMEESVHAAIESGRKNGGYKGLLAKARSCRGLSPDEAAVFLQTDDGEVWAEVFRAARHIKEEIYGKRIVIFAPLYISDYCVNSCIYCGYRCGNGTGRRRLSQAEIAREVEILEDMGHKRLALEAGEDPAHAPLSYILESMDTIYRVRKARGNIRRINVNIAAASVDDYRRLKTAGIGTYILFQETYHRPTYEKVHPAGPKRNYDRQLSAFDRAMQAGIDDVGAGVLFGLYDYKFEVVSLIIHAAHLEEKFGVGPHTVSVPRLRPAPGVRLDGFPLVSDEEFRRIVALLRLALPYTGIILSTREEPSFRREVISLGVSQISAGSRTTVGGYGAQTSTPQFEVGDHRRISEIILELLNDGYLPSFCTACYRQGRTGDRFMALAKSGEIKKVCAPNAILTFQEYLQDYADADLEEKGRTAIERHLSCLDPVIRGEVSDKLMQIKGGNRDLYY
ncbi:MAG: [FeFe] hydrogenase H-cluster radical SAM maturase HydG [Bacillota bacterium]